MQLRTAARIGAIVLAGVAYVAVSHWLMTQARDSVWNVVAVLTPMLVFIAVGAWRSGHRRLGAAAVLAIAILCVQALMGIQVSPHALYLLQHAGIYLFLAGVFGSTLRPGHTALITALARRVHGGHMVPAMAIYTRHVTIAWMIFFAVVAGVSGLLYAFAPFETWAVFSNIVSPIAVAVMFGVEYLIRYRIHPDFERASVADAVRAYMQGAKPPARPAGDSGP